jgi:transcriptional regulator with XRE-family HTH domain
VAAPTIQRLLARLRQLRKTHNLTQEQFSELSGISYKYYQAIEAGRKRDLRLSTLERLAAAYGLEVHSLLAPGLPRTKVRRRVDC